MSSSALTLCDPGSAPCPLWVRLFKSRGGDLLHLLESPATVSFTQDTHTGGPWEPGLHFRWARGPGWWLRGVKTVELPFPTLTTPVTWLRVPCWSAPCAKGAGRRVGRWSRPVPVSFLGRGVDDRVLAGSGSPSGLQSQGRAHQGGWPGRDRRRVGGMQTCFGFSCSHGQREARCLS